MSSIASPRDAQRDLDESRIGEETGQWAFPPAFGMEGVAEILPDGFVAWPNPFMIQSQPENPKHDRPLCTDPSRPPCLLLLSEPLAEFDPAKAPAHICPKVAMTTTERWAGPVAYRAALDTDERLLRHWVREWPLPIGREALARKAAWLIERRSDDVAAAWLRLLSALPFAGGEMAAVILTGEVGENTITAFGLIKPLDDLWDETLPRRTFTLGKMVFVVSGPEPSDDVRTKLERVQSWWKPFTGRKVGPGAPRGSRTFQDRTAFVRTFAWALRRHRAEPRKADVARDLYDDLKDQSAERRLTRDLRTFLGCTWKELKADGWRSILTE